jgi:hypothetical protein
MLVAVPDTAETVKPSIIYIDALRLVALPAVLMQCPFSIAGKSVSDL